MRHLQTALIVALLLWLGASLGCETDQPKKNNLLHPAAQATAPTVSAPTAKAAVSTSAATAVAPKTQPDNPTKPDSTDAIIAAAEKQFEAGKGDYAAGHLEAARKDFDDAFNTLLSSNLDVHNNPRLEQEFDKLVESVSQIEMVALKQGDGFTEQRSEPAPIDEANDVTFPVDPHVKAKAAAEIQNTKSDLPLVMNDEVAMFINYFSSTRGKGTVERALARAGRYREMISQTLSQQGVPQDLIYLAQAESGFQPLALSHAGARGMWQFMAGRASMYGLERNAWVDERQDPDKSTLAAARHLKDLYNQFGDWYLAMAAYNSGPGTIQHAVERTGYADFWELYRRNVLPKETRNYVPIIVAVTIMAKNPTQYGLEGVVPEPAAHADQVKIDYPVDLRLVAECVDTSVNSIQELNPSLLRMTTPKDQSFILNLPAGAAGKYQAAIALIPHDMRTLWRYHQVEYGDTLATIAHKYHTTSTSISDANGLTSEDVTVGAKLIIPVTASQRDSEGAFSRKATHYKIRKGDTIYSVADDFEVPVEKLRKWNHLRGTALVPGRTLIIYKPGPESAGTENARSSGSGTSKSAKSGKSAKTGTANSNSQATASAKYHKVQKGETLTSIAESYNTTVAELKRDNPKLAANLRAGEVLVIKK